MTHPHRHRRRRVLLPTALAVAALAGAGSTALSPAPAEAATARQVENLDRGVVSVHTGSGNLVSRCRLGTDPDDAAFSVYRAGTKVDPAPVTASTTYFHAGAPSHAVIRPGTCGSLVLLVEWRSHAPPAVLVAPCGPGHPARTPVVPCSPPTGWP